MKAWALSWRDSLQQWGNAWLKEWRDDRVLTGMITGVITLIVGALVLLIWAIPGSIEADRIWRQHCTQDLGGRVVSHTETGIGYDYKGRPVTSSSTTTYCLSPSGGILDIE